MLWLTFIGCACWPVCFWWMHRISKRQDSVLQELQEQAKRIEYLSKEEHDLVKELHPQVGEIKDGVEQIAEATNGRAQDKSRLKTAGK